MSSVSEQPITARVLGAIEVMDEETAKRILRLYLENNEWLDDHNPEGDEQYGLFPCSGRAEYHLCSFSLRHSPECEQGKPTPSPRDPERTWPPCPVPCEEGPPLPWCKNSGTDCPDCQMVVELRAILNALGGSHQLSVPSAPTREGGST